MAGQIILWQPGNSLGVLDEYSDTEITAPMIISLPKLLPISMDLLDRFRGCLLGLAVGDALGMPIEGYSAKEIESKFGAVRDMMPASQDHFHAGLKAGQYTDDTLETLLLARSMIESCGFSADHFAKRLSQWGGTWALDERLARGAGFATRSSVESMVAGTAWQESGLPIPTCGSAMRASPIGLVYHCDLSLAARYADLQSLPTHCGAAARAGAVAVAVGVALCIKGFSKETVLRVVCDQSRMIDEEFGTRLLRIGTLLNLEPSDALSLIGNSPMVTDTVPSAFYCFLKLEPEEALILAASSGGDTDSIASIAGSLFGALLGTAWIPERWLSCLEDREKIEKTADGLKELSAMLCGG
jgi:ADP-ribosyl-[dinitrogen reductase] hydrolase